MGDSGQRCPGQGRETEGENPWSEPEDPAVRRDMTKMLQRYQGPASRGTRQAGALANLGERQLGTCLLYTSPSPRDGLLSRMPSSA